MPRYFFDTDGGDAPHRDREGLLLPCLNAAKDEAAGLLRDLSHGAPREGCAVFTCAIRQDAGEPVYRLTMAVEGAPV